MPPAARPFPAPSVCTAALVVACATAAPAQCGLAWGPGDLAGADRAVHASLLWDRDGAGPLPPLVVVGGEFRAIGGIVANGVAAYNPTTQQWSSLGAGLDGTVRSLAVLPSGDLAVGGSFTQAGGTAAACVARWDGTSWFAFGAGIGGGTLPVVEALVVAPNGGLVAGGQFTTAGGVTAVDLAQWSGGAWQPIGGGISGVTVLSLAYLPSGNLVVGGTFWQAGNVAVNNIAQWDGVMWSGLGGGITLPLHPARVEDLQVLGNGRLAVAGVFSMVGGIPGSGVVVWDGASWSVLGLGISYAQDVEVTANGDIVAAGIGVMRWDGTAWTSVGGATLACTCITALGNDDFVVGGVFTSIGTLAAFNLGRLTQGVWAAVVASSLPALEPPLRVVAGNGNQLLVTKFTGATSRAFLWDGTRWSDISTGLPSYQAAVAQSVVLSDGTILAGGGSPSLGMVRWGGTAWVAWPPASAMITRFALLPLPQGELLVAGFFLGGLPGSGISRWDGLAWTHWPSTWGARQLARLPEGDVIAGGNFTSIGGISANRIARFDGSLWHALGSGLDGEVTSIVASADGSVVVAGPFTMAGGVPAQGVARWHSGAWSAFGTSFQPTRLASLPNGEVLAVGDFTATSTGWLVRGDGVQWTTLSGLNGKAQDVVVQPNGDAWTVGEFTNAGGVGAGHIARLTSTCPASAAPYGAGCAGSAGALALQALTLPWLGSVARSTGGSITPGSLVIGVIGWSSTQVSLSSIHPAAGPGCSALVSSDALVWLPDLGGRVALVFGVPNAPALVGVTLRQQLLQAEFGASGGLALLSSSNALELRTGSL